MKEWVACLFVTLYSSVSVVAVTSRSLVCTSHCINLRCGLEYASSFADVISHYTVRHRYISAYEISCNRDETRWISALHFLAYTKQCCNWLLGSFLCDGVVFVVTGGWQLLDVAAGCVGVTSDVCVEQNTRLRPFNVYCTDARICCDFSHSFHCHLIRLFALYPGFS